MGFLPVQDFLGHDGKQYRDLAVDSNATDSLVVWVRKRLHDGAYFVVASVTCGHTMRKEVTKQEAIELYHALGTKIPYHDAFESGARKHKSVPTKEKEEEQDKPAKKRKSRAKAK